jgi:hypothetical protein
MKPGGPYEVMAQQTLGRINFTLRVHDVLFGDVWLCSGQSNMKMTVSQVICKVSVIITLMMKKKKKEEERGEEEQEVEAKICSKCFLCMC